MKKNYDFIALKNYSLGHFYGLITLIFLYFVKLNNISENYLKNNFERNINIFNSFSIIDQIQKDLNKNQSNTDNFSQSVKLDIAMTNENLQNSLSSEGEERKVSPFLENQSLNTTEPNYDEGRNKQSIQKDRNAYLTLKKKILENLSEEINTHVKLILDYADQLKHFQLPLEANKVLQKIIDKSNFIINSLKAQTSLYNGDLELNTQVIYATTLFDDILNLLSGYTEFRGVKLYRSFEADASILADKNMLYQACLDIVKFLCEFMQNKGEINTVLTRTKDTIILEFQSKGVIISDDLFKNVLRDAASEDRMTLNYAQNIVRAHKGSIKTGRTIDSALEIKLELPIIR